MNIHDLHHIFKDQISVGEEKLYFMIIDGDHTVIERHTFADINNLIPMLDCFDYVGNDAGMPRFAKNIQ